FGVGSTASIRLRGLESASKAWSASREEETRKPGDRNAALAWLHASRRHPSLPPGRSLPHFHVRFTRPRGGTEPIIYRVFVAQEEFLFVSLYTNTFQPEQRTNPGVGIGGLVGGLVAGFNATMHTLAMEDLRIHLRTLEGVSDENVLRSFIERDPESFTLNMS